MATDWGPIVQTGVGAVAAVGGGAVGAWLTGIRQSQTERRQRVDRAAEVLAQARALLTDATPDPLGINANPTTSEKTFTDLGERWQRTRIPLLTLATGDPSKRVRDLAGQLEVAIANMLAQSRWMVSDILKNRDAADARNTANQQHANATRLLGQLQDAIHKA